MRGGRVSGRATGVVDGPLILVGIMGVGIGIYGAVKATGWFVSKPVNGFDDFLTVGRQYWWVTLIGVAIVAAVTGGVIVWFGKVTADRRLRNYFRNKPGMRDSAQLLRIGGRRAVKKRAPTLRPSLATPDLEDVGYFEGKLRGRQVWSTVEDSVYVLGPPRSGKGFFIVINRILDAPGAVVTTSTRPDNIVATMQARKSQGRPVVVFDPERLAPGVAGGVRWSPVRGCEDARTAAVRAKGFVAAGFPAKGENQMWQDIAGSILRCLLHAAALEGFGARELYRWSVEPAKARDAVDILLRHPMAVPGWGEELQAALDQDERTRDSSWLGVRQSLSGLADPTVLESVSPRPGEEFDPERLIRERGTLYMIGTSDGAVTSAPLITAFIEDVVNVGKRIASASSGARLDPPVGLVLDEAANYPIPSLPSLMSEGGGSGICTLAVFQSVGQPRKVYGPDESDAIWDSATLKLVLGGAGKRDTLEDISILVGERDDSTTSVTQNSILAITPASVQESLRRVRILPPDEIRQLPFGMALIMLRAAPLAFIDLTPWNQRRGAKELKAGAKELTKQIEAEAARIATAR